MLTILSPAKTLDMTPQPAGVRTTQPMFLDDAEELIAELRTLSVADVQALMGVSERLAAENCERFRAWRRPFHRDNAKAAVFVFRGDVYQGLDADSFSADDLKFAQAHLRILSGLYGVLRPLDLMQAYRLEMGTRLANPRGDDLYAFWGDRIREHLARATARHGTRCIVNLASQEYAKAAQLDQLDRRIVTPQFREFKNGRYRVLSFFAKRARGRMAGWIMRRRIDDPEQLLAFNADGYTYNEELSEPDAPVFTRPQP